MFGTDWSLSFLSMCSRWHSAGTFNIRSRLFEQVYVICGYNEGFMIACINTLTREPSQLIHADFAHILPICRGHHAKTKPKRI